MTLEELYKTKPLIIRRIFPYVHCYETAEDIVQDAFLKAFSTISTFNPHKSSLKTWFNKVLFSSVWDWKRREKRQVPSCDISGLADFDDITEMSDSTLDDLMEEISNSLHRKVLFCLYEAGYNYSETAYICDVSEANVRKIVQRFRGKLNDT
jgi:RNA polymerase sigma-70 factor (ECF subfamily)